MILNIPYQNHANKAIFDYFLTCCNQQNNINFADSLVDAEAESNNHVYFCILNSDVHLFVPLSKKENEDKYSSLLEIWSKLNDVELIDDTDSQAYLDCLIYRLDIAKLFSALSYCEYQDRKLIPIIVDEETNYSNLACKIYNKLDIKLATRVFNCKLQQKNSN